MLATIERIDDEKEKKNMLKDVDLEINILFNKDELPSGYGTYAKETEVDMTEEGLASLKKGSELTDENSSRNPQNSLVGAKYQTEEKKIIDKYNRYSDRVLNNDKLAKRSDILKLRRQKFEEEKEKQQEQFLLRKNMEERQHQLFNQNRERMEKRIQIRYNKGHIIKEEENKHSWSEFKTLIGDLKPEKKVEDNFILSDNALLALKEITENAFSNDMALKNKSIAKL